MDQDGWDVKTTINYSAFFMTSKYTDELANSAPESVQELSLYAVKSFKNLIYFTGLRKLTIENLDTPKDETEEFADYYPLVWSPNLEIFRVAINRPLPIINELINKEYLNLKEIRASAHVTFNDFSNYPNLQILSMSYPNRVGRTYIKENQLSAENIAQISALSHLTTLICKCNLFKHNFIIPVTLQVLHCSNAELTELPPVENTTLEVLTLDHNNITVIDLSKLPNTLYKLNLTKNKLTNITGTHNTLEELNISHNQLTTLEFAELPIIKILLCENTKISECDFMKFPTLEELYLANTAITLLSLPKSIIRLELTDCEISDDILQSISKLTKIKYLFLSDNNITDLSPLADLKDLETLDIIGNPIEYLEYVTYDIINLYTPVIYDHNGEFVPGKMKLLTDFDYSGKLTESEQKIIDTLTTNNF